MSQDTPRHEITKKRVVYQIPGMEGVTVRRDVAYRQVDGDVLTMDIYYPLDSNSGARTPAVIFVTGYPDAGFQKRLGCRQKEMESYISWAQLTAALGMVAITYTNREPVADAHQLLQYVQHNAASLGIDENRIGLWACSGNVPMALSLLMENDQKDLKCAVLCYGIMLDLDDSTCVADASRLWGFVNARPIPDPGRGAQSPDHVCESPRSPARVRPVA
jgi:hypothetical protein